MATATRDWAPPPDDFQLDELPRCKNCGEPIEGHWKDSDPPWMCKEQVGSVYGFFHGGDPRHFHPDSEDCSPQEIENHRKACEQADEADRLNADPGLPCPSGWIRDENGKAIAHVLRAPFGIGVTTYPTTYYER